MLLYIMPKIPKQLPKEITDKYSTKNNAFRLAYFCAPCKNRRNNPNKALKLADEMGYKLWMPEKEVSGFDYSEGALECQEAIDKSNIIICQPPIGRDCAWELGYAVAKNKPIYVLGELDSEDWMTKLGNITYV